jgi:hypothetical protein
MTQPTLYKECPVCNQGAVVWQDAESVYRCDHCSLTLREQTLLGLFNKGHFGVVSFPKSNYALAEQSLSSVSLKPDPLKVVLGNVYTDEQLAEIAGGAIDDIRPVRTTLAQIILEQLRETCFLQVNGLRRGHGQPLTEGGNYIPMEAVPRQGIEWQDEGNLFCTDQRLVFPSNKFTFIRMGRKLVGVRAFSNGIAIQLKGDESATYFVGCLPHEAALVAAYVMAKVPKLRAEEVPT